MVSSKELAESFLAFSKQENVSEDNALTAFFEFMKIKGLETLLPDVLRHVKQLKQDQHAQNILTIQVPYAHKEDVISDIKSYVKNSEDHTGDEKNRERSTVIKKSLLGGFVATKKGKEYNVSLQRRLERLHAHLIG